MQQKNINKKYNSANLISYPLTLLIYITREKHSIVVLNKLQMSCITFVYFSAWFLQCREAQITAYGELRALLSSVSFPKLTILEVAERGSQSPECAESLYDGSIFDGRVL